MTEEKKKRRKKRKAVRLVELHFAAVRVQEAPGENPHYSPRPERLPRPRRPPPRSHRRLPRTIPPGHGQEVVLLL